MMIVVSLGNLKTKRLEAEDDLQYSYISQESNQ